MTHIEKKPIIIFDWDGVLADSNGWKWRDMWGEIFPSDPIFAEEAIRLLATPEGRSLNRYELVRRVLIQGGHTELTDADAVSAHNHPVYKGVISRFQTVSLGGVLKRGLFEGVHGVLERLAGRGHSLYIITGSAHEDLIFLLDRLGVSHFFRKTFGVVRGQSRGGVIKKYDAYLQIVEIEGTTDPAHYVVIGDGETDLKLATEIGCKFIGVVNPWNGWKDVPFSLIRDITELEAHV